MKPYTHPSDFKYEPDNFPLHSAILNKNVVLAKALIEKGGVRLLYEENSFTCETSLHYALSHLPGNELGLTEYMLDILHQDTTLLEKRNKWGETPLDIAIKNRDYKIIEFIKKKFISKNKYYRSVEHAFKRIIDSLDIEAASLLINAGASLTETTSCSSNTYLHRVIKLISSKKYMKLLHSLSAQKINDMAYLLIDNGAPLDATISNGNTPLHDAIEYRMTDIALYILKNIKTEALLKMKNKSNNTPLDLAILKGNEKVTAYIAENYYSCLNLQNEFGGTPLNLAIRCSENNIITQLLINAGASLSSPDAFGVTPLTYAISRCKYDTAEFLIKKGASSLTLEINEKFKPHDRALISATNKICIIPIKKITGANVKLFADNKPSLWECRVFLLPENHRQFAANIVKNEKSQKICFCFNKGPIPLYSLRYIPIIYETYCMDNQDAYSSINKNSIEEVLNMSQSQLTIPIDTATSDAHHIVTTML